MSVLLHFSLPHISAQDITEFIFNFNRIVYFCVYYIQNENTRCKVQLYPTLSSPTRKSLCLSFICLCTSLRCMCVYFCTALLNLISNALMGFSVRRRDATTKTVQQRAAAPLPNTRVFIINTLLSASLQECFANIDTLL